MAKFDWGDTEGAEDKLKNMEAAEIISLTFVNGKCFLFSTVVRPSRSCVISFFIRSFRSTFHGQAREADDACVFQEIG